MQKSFAFLSAAHMAIFVIARAKLNALSNEREYNHGEFCKCHTSHLPRQGNGMVEDSEICRTAFLFSVIVPTNKC